MQNPLGSSRLRPASGDTPSLVSVFARQVALRGDKPAVKFGAQQLSFYELDARSSALARRLLEVDGPENRPVAAILGEGLDPLVALMGTLKAGKAYVPLDVAHGLGRLEAILRDATAQTIVTNNAARPAAESLAPVGRIVNLDDLPSASVAPVTVEPPPDALAILIYTSGSTGEPKGVTNTFDQLTYSVTELTRSVDPSAEDRVASLASFAFAGGVKPRMRALLNGATIHIGGTDMVTSLPEILLAREITWLVTSPSTMRQIAQIIPHGTRFPHLRMVRFGNEPLLKRDVELFRETFPGIPLVNILGTTETSSFRAFRLSPDQSIGGDFVPVGYQLGDMETLLLDENLAPVPPGREGQIAVKGPHISDGYWRRPELTAQRFVADPSDGRRMYLTGDTGRLLDDGCLIHLGRRDFQAKIRAFRVEPAAVETALLSHADVSAAAVLSLQMRDGESYLAAYYVPRKSSSPTVSSLRRHLEQRLADYMIPSAFVEMDSFPLTPNGKLDRRALPAPERRRPSLDVPFTAASTPLEEKVAAVWREVLDIDRVGVEDDFFDLGGHSLRAAGVAARLRNDFGVEIAVHEFLSARTVSSMTLLITERLAGASGVDIERLIGDSPSA